jgi:hypothetical protein
MLAISRSDLLSWVISIKVDHVYKCRWIEGEEEARNVKSWKPRIYRHQISNAECGISIMSGIQNIDFIA